MDKLLGSGGKGSDQTQKPALIPILPPLMSDSSPGFPHCPESSDKESLPRPLDNKASIANTFRTGAGRDKFVEFLWALKLSRFAGRYNNQTQ